MQGFNRYYPPDYDPTDKRHKGNLNRLAGKSAQKAVVRFEMPFNVWCLQCESHIAQGVRFNAKKEKTGNYFSSPIYSFTMTCHLCCGQIIIATNPKETCYDVLQGARKKVEEWNVQDSATFSYTATREEGDPLYKLEKDATQKANLKDSKSHITSLMDLNRRQWADPYSTSQKLRRGFRSEKKKMHKETLEREMVKDKHSLGIDLLDPCTADHVKAKSVEFETMRNVSRVLTKPLFRDHSKGSIKAKLHSNTVSRIDPFNASTVEMKEGVSEHTLLVKRQDQSQQQQIPQKKALVGYVSSEED